MESECNELYDTLRVLLATLGYPIFEPLVKVSFHSTNEIEGPLFFCNASAADAKGMETEEGFVVLKGSTGRVATVPTFREYGHDRMRNHLKEKGVIVEENGRIRFEKDHLFSSPSAAAICVTGRTANGLVEWKDRNGNTLRDVRNSERSTPDH